MEPSTKVLLWLGDVIISCFVLFPLMLFYWRGIWDLIGVYIFPEDELKRCWTVASLGCASIVGYVTHPMVDSALRSKSLASRFLLTKVYLALYTVLPMAYWRGVWTMADYYLGIYGWHGALILYVACEILLLTARVRQSAIFPPLYVYTDTGPGVLQPSTRFQIKPEVTWLYTGDALFSHFYTMTFTILLWRGAWVVADSWFQDVDYTWFHVVSFGAGYAATLFFLLLDPLFLAGHRFISEKCAVHSKCSRLAAVLTWEAIVYISAFWAHFFLWRGAWVLDSIYVLADPEQGGWLNHLLGVLGFCVFNVYSLVGVCGCTVDGNIDDKGDRWFSTHYLPYVLQDFRELRSCYLRSKANVHATEADEKKRADVPDGHIGGTNV